MRKILSAAIGSILLVGILAMPVISKAVSDTSSLEEIVASLHEQIAQLKVQIENLQTQAVALKQAKAEVKETTQEIKSTLQLTKHLRYGMSGDDVKTLQELLATDPTIYPEGLITGYFGPLTQRAVKRLQKMTCIDQVGLVGPQTMRRVNELLEYGAGNSGKVPKGLLTAPGIQKKLCGTPVTTTPDTTAPVILDVIATGTTATASQINWTTDELSDSTVWYGTGTPVITATPTAMVSSNDDVLFHEIGLSGLTASTTYYYVAVSIDKSNNTATSAENSFTTLGE